MLSGQGFSKSMVPDTQRTMDWSKDFGSRRLSASKALGWLMFTAGTSQSGLAILSQLLGRGTDRNVRSLRFSGGAWSQESHLLPIPFNTQPMPSQTVRHRLGDLLPIGLSEPRALSESQPPDLLQLCFHLGVDGHHTAIGHGHVFRGIRMNLRPIERPQFHTTIPP